VFDTPSVLSSKKGY